jgi:hypothetical protein
MTNFVARPYFIDCISSQALRNRPFLNLTEGTTGGLVPLLGMRPVITALVAIVILWVLDHELNDGRYTMAARQMISSISGGRI